MLLVPNHTVHKVELNTTETVEIIEIVLHQNKGMAWKTFIHWKEMFFIVCQSHVRRVAWFDLWTWLGQITYKTSCLVP